MNRRQALIAGTLGMATLGRAHLAAAHRQQGATSTAAPSGTIMFEPIPNPTAEDLERVSMLATVTRNTWGPEANLSGDCFDFFTGGPEIILVEEGLLRVSVFEPREPSSDMPEVIAPPTVFRAEEGHAPAYAEPNTQLELRHGDAIVFPDGAKCGRYGDEEGSPVTFLEVTMLPGSPADPWISEDVGMTGEVVDIGLGADTSDAPAAPVVAGRLRIEAGGALTLDDLGMPIALFLETGEITMNAIHDGALARDISFTPSDRTVWLASGQDVSLVPGNHVYIPATATGTISVTSAVSCLMVAMDFAAATG